MSVIAACCRKKIALGDDSPCSENCHLWAVKAHCFVCGEPASSMWSGEQNIGLCGECMWDSARHVALSHNRKSAPFAGRVRYDIERDG
jgi:hypothetical protein